MPEIDPKIKSIIVFYDSEQVQIYLQFLISEINTAKPRIPSPFTAGILVYKLV